MTRRLLPLCAALVASCHRASDRGLEKPARGADAHQPPLVAIAAPRGDSSRCAALHPSDSLAATRAGFLLEVLDTRPSRRTPRFDAYHEDSYGVDKQDAAAGLVEVSRACGIPLRGVVFVGPVGMLWAYYVLAFLQESPNTVRVNEVLMPHARITDKATGVIAASTFDSVFRALTASPLVEPRARPLAARANTSALGREFGFDLLIVRVVGDSTATWSAAIRQSPDTTAARLTLAPIDTLLGHLTPTYPDSATRARRARED